MKLFTIGGGSCSGKSTLADQLRSLVPGQHVFVLSLDRYYDDTAHFSPEEAAETNLDVPDAIDIGMVLRDVEEFYTGTIQFLPQYDFITRKRTFGPFPGPQPDILVLEGLFALHYTSLNSMSDSRIFVDASPDVMLARRIARDTSTRGNTEQEIIARYDRFIRESYKSIILPTRQHAQVIVDGESPIDSQLAAIRPTIIAT